MVVPLDRSSMTDITIQDNRDKITAALEQAGIAKQITDLSPELTENAKVVLERRYLSKDRQGNILEDPDGMFRRVAQNLSQNSF